MSMFEANHAVIFIKTLMTNFYRLYCLTRRVWFGNNTSLSEIYNLLKLPEFSIFLVALASYICIWSVFSSCIASILLFYKS